MKASERNKRLASLEQEKCEAEHQRGLARKEWRQAKTPDVKDDYKRQVEEWTDKLHRIDRAINALHLAEQSAA
jgi:hypothetical protein